MIPSIVFLHHFLSSYFLYSPRILCHLLTTFSSFYSYSPFLTPFYLFIFIFLFLCLCFPFRWSHSGLFSRSIQRRRPHTLWHVHTVSTAHNITIQYQWLWPVNLPLTTIQSHDLLFLFFFFFVSPSSLLILLSTLSLLISHLLPPFLYHFYFIVPAQTIAHHSHNHNRYQNLLDFLFFSFFSNSFHSILYWRQYPMSK